MGEVYEALDRDHDTRVALKVLTALNADSLLRFKTEFRALRDVEHPNVVSFGELLEHDGRWFFTMEFIEGVDFLEYVRPRIEDTSEPTTVRVARPPTRIPSQRPLYRERPVPFQSDPAYDEGRLRHALAQLARGVSALHAAGKIHRDIKPSNVRVTHEGRVVLLDFGLVTDRENPAHLTDVEKIVGTPAFMAPEQAGMREVGPAADWYSVGAVLYLSLTGQLPFGGGTMEILLDKQRFEPAPPRALVRNLPPDLDALTVDLLNREPGNRPDDRQVLRRLGIESNDNVYESSPSLGHTTPFVGRADELEQLRAAFDRSREGFATTVYLHGESGVGKSALTRSFCETMAAERSAVVLSGRCYESELVPFKAVDGLIDALSRYLMSLPRAEAAALLPAKALLMTQVFPVLRRVEAIAESPVPPDVVRDPQELRGRTFAAVRELLSRLSERRPVILTLDDMQWSDADSLVLLREVMRVPEAPSLMLVLSLRTDASGADPVTAHDLMMPGEMRHIRLQRLPRREARELAARLLSQHGEVDESLAHAIADEAVGHPLFIDELARHFPAAQGRAERLEEALWDRIAKLDDAARSILEVVAVADAPLVKETAARAVGIDFGEFQKRVSLLRVSHLLRWSDHGHADSLEPYHERVRAAVLAHLGPEECTVCHRRIALAIEASGQADLEALAVHWRGAGEADKAVGYALQAATQATAALAFERAAQLYRLALELGIDDARLAQRVRVRFGDALRNAGRGPEAAQAYLEAARSARLNVSSADRLELQRRAAEQLLLSGHFDDGMAALRTVLAAIGMELPATPARALASLLWHRARLRLRGLGFRERDESQVSAEELTRSDVSWSVSAGLALIDNVRGADFQCRNLLQALGNGEPHRIARALAIEAGHASIGGDTRGGRSQRLLAAAEELATRLGDPYALGLQKIVGAMAALLAGRWRKSCELCDQGEAILRAHCTGVSWELDSAQMFGMDSLWFLGELRELARRQPLRVAEAQARGDLYAVINFRSGAPNLVWLALDAVDEGRRHVREAMARWSRSGVHIQHYRELFSLMHIDLYTGDGATAYARALDRWQSLERAQLFRVKLIHNLMTDLRARAALAAAASRPDPEALWRRARRDARTLERGGMGWCMPAAQMVRAALAVRRAPEVAVRLLHEAVHGFAAADMPMHAEVARRRLGLVLGGDEGRALVTTAEAWLRDAGVQNPAAMTAMLAPGFAD
jgi:serine/threonine protein kinase